MNSGKGPALSPASVERQPSRFIGSSECNSSVATVSRGNSHDGTTRTDHGG